jgi:hypothetical protein
VYRVERRTDPTRLGLHEVDVLRVALGGTEVKLVKSGAAAERERVCDDRVREQLHKRPRDDEVLLDLAVGDPGR